MAEVIKSVLILQIITLAATTITPIVAGIGFMIKHIKKSTCCGSSIELERHDQSEDDRDSTTLLSHRGHAVP